MLREEFYYELPSNRIALYPSHPRDSCRLIVVHRNSGHIEHRIFSDIVEYLESGDCLVLNYSKVHPVRFRLRRRTGGVVELLFIQNLGDNRWESLARPAKRLKTGEILVGERGEEIVKIQGVKEGKLTLELMWEEDELFRKLGMAPLPVYIQRIPEDGDKENYQTVYASRGFSIAAPTAGLHFTDELLNRIKEEGVQVAFIQLDVGEGTFRPITSENVEDHYMAAEDYTVTQDAAESIDNAKRVIAVGTTVTRTLESFDAGQPVTAGSSSTGLFIYPGHEFSHVDVLLTNFHQPCSTPLLLTASFTGKELLFRAYRQALKRDYRFLSYGDAMLVL